MFKTDKESLEKLSFAFNEEDIARFRRLLVIMKDREIACGSIEEMSRLADGLDAIGKLKLDKKFYAFHIFDSYSEEKANEGIEVYQRQGDLLEPYIQLEHGDGLLNASQVAYQLRKRNIEEVFTGPIPYGGSFLGLEQTCDDEDPIIRSKLNEEDILEMKRKGIAIIVLDYLI